jgi:hypothetical protein
MNEDISVERAGPSIVLREYRNVAPKTDRVGVAADAKRMLVKNKPAGRAGERRPAGFLSSLQD